tara:strand:- start:282 stop:746 length:465 start_codon:yes stop_codon:yes gene_type:complete
MNNYAGVMMTPIPFFLIPMLAGLCAQALKPLFNKKLYSTLAIAGRQIPRYGGMPSAHSAFTASLVTVAGVIDGIDSMTFAVAVAVFVLTIDDALRMRMFLGRYGLALNKLVKRLPKDAQRQFPYLESNLGHKPLEVIAGITLGVAVTVIILVLL